MNIDPKTILSQLMGCDIGSDINSEYSVISKNDLVLRCWDGRRFRLTFEQLSDSRPICTKTGEEL